MRSIFYILLCIFTISLVISITPLSWFDTQAVDGSFGLRTKTHRCIGFTLEPKTAYYFPSGSFSFPLLFGKKFIYDVGPINERSYCLGQDMWFGE
jgi:hypothetical protein